MEVHVVRHGVHVVRHGGARGAAWGFTEHSTGVRHGGAMWTCDSARHDGCAHGCGRQKGYVDQYGLHHWWLDCDEPCGGTNNGSYATDWLYNDGKWPSAFVGAAYPQMLDRAVWEGMGAPGKAYEHDNVMLGRAAWAGSQRYGGGVWSGDTKSSIVKRDSTHVVEATSPTGGDPRSRAVGTHVAETVSPPKAT